MRKKRSPAVSEPVQVYLTTADRKLLRDVAAASGLSGAEVLRRGLRRMAGEILADRSPAIRLLEEMNAGAWSADTPPDAALNHDRYLTDAVATGSGRRRPRR